MLRLSGSVKLAGRLRASHSGHLPSRAEIRVAAASISVWQCSDDDGPRTAGNTKAAISKGDNNTTLRINARVLLNRYSLYLRRSDACFWGLPAVVRGARQ